LVQARLRNGIPLTTGMKANLHSLVFISYRAATTCALLGYQDLAIFAAAQCRRFAELQDEPADVGMANWVLFRVLPEEPETLQVIIKGIQFLEQYVGTDMRAADMYGMHHLAAAQLSAVSGNNSRTMDHLAEATKVASYTGEAALEPFTFGPRNVAIWRVGLLATLGEGSQALAAPELHSAAVRSANRFAYYQLHRARALLQTRGRDAEALSALLRAETIAPQLVRLENEAQTVLKALIGRSTVNRRPELRDLMRRVGFLD